MNNYLKDAIALLKSEKVIDIHKKISYQTKMLDAYTYNNNQTEIFDQLENLYEKVNILEDVSSYIQTEMENKIQLYSYSCKALLDEIEESRDKIKTSTYKTCSVPLLNTTAHYDRDLKELPKADVFNNAIIQKYYEKNNYIYNANCNYSLKPYKDNIRDLEEKKAYRVYYITETCNPNGISQQVNLFLSPSQKVNMITIKVSNCDIENVQILSGINVIDIETENWKTPILTDQIQINICCKNYISKSFLCDELRIAPNAINQLNNLMFKKLNNEDFSNQEIESLLGIKKYKDDYAKYISEVNNWTKKRSEIANINIANGYEDSVPCMTVIKPPENLGINTVAQQETYNTTINTSNILYNKNIVSSKNNFSIQKKYDWIEKTYPTSERYRLDINNDERGEKLWLWED